MLIYFCGCSRFSDLNLPPKNWTFPCTVATLGDIKVRGVPFTCRIQRSKTWKERESFDVVLFELPP